MSGRRSSPRSRGKEPAKGAFPLPPALAKLPAGRHRMPKEFVAQNQRNRILFGALNVFGEKGFAAATVKDLIEEAGVSRATFYKYFDDKAACFAAVHEEALTWLGEGGRDAAKAAADWPSAVLAVGERVIGLLVDDPRLARVCTVEWMFGGPEVRSRQEAALAELTAGLRKGRGEQPWGADLPESAEEFLIGGAVSLTARMVAYGQRSGAEALVSELPELVLLLYLGSGEAARVARPPA